MNNKNLISLTILKNIIKNKRLDKYIKKIEYSKDNIHKYIITNINDKKIKIGNINYEDFLIHNDPIRRDNYKKRFYKMYQRFKDDINSKMYWNWNILW